LPSRCQYPRRRGQKLRATLSQVYYTGCPDSGQGVRTVLSGSPVSTVQPAPRAGAPSTGDFSSLSQGKGLQGLHSFSPAPLPDGAAPPPGGRSPPREISAPCHRGKACRACIHSPRPPCLLFAAPPPGGHSPPGDFSSLSQGKSLQGLHSFSPAPVSTVQPAPRRALPSPEISAPCRRGKACRACIHSPRLLFRRCSPPPGGRSPPRRFQLPVAGERPAGLAFILPGSCFDGAARPPGGRSLPEISAPCHRGKACRACIHSLHNDIIKN